MFSVVEWENTDLVLDNETGDNWADDTRNGCCCIGQPHDETGVLRSNIQNVDTGRKKNEIEL